MKKGQTTKAIHPKSNAKVQIFSELRKQLQEKKGIHAAAITRKDLPDGNVSYISLIGTYAGSTQSRDGELIAIFDDCTFAGILSHPNRYRHDHVSRLPIKANEIVSILFIEDLPC